jgi:hypothetical protein
MRPSGHFIPEHGPKHNADHESNYAACCACTHDSTYPSAGRIVARTAAVPIIMR